MKNINIISLTSVISYRKVISYGRFQDSKTKGDNNYFKLFKEIKKGSIKSDSEAQEFLGIENWQEISVMMDKMLQDLFKFLADDNPESAEIIMKNTNIIMYNISLFLNYRRYEMGTLL